MCGGRLRPEYRDIDPMQQRWSTNEKVGKAMKKYERRQFFERLVQLRALYRLRGTDDSASVMSIEDAIGYGERLIGDGAALAEALGPDASTQTGSTTPGSRPA